MWRALGACMGLSPEDEGPPMQSVLPSHRLVTFSPDLLHLAPPPSRPASKNALDDNVMPIGIPSFLPVKAKDGHPQV